jgi:predicted MPP superfamily phosphohydrolase
MPRILVFAMFFAVLSLVVVALHYYLWRRLVRAPAWPSPWSSLGTRLVVGLALVVPVGVPLARSLPQAWAGPVAAIAFAWMGFGFLLVVAAFVTDLVAWIGSGALVLLARKREAPVDPARRQILARGTAGVASFAGLGLGGAALRGGLGEVEVKEVPVRLERLPPALDGFTLVQLTDVHVGTTIGRRFVDQIVEKANAQRPDAIVITGDLVDGSVAELMRDVAPLAKLRARHGVYFCLGNHEYYSGVEGWVAHLQKLGIRVLRNERTVVGDASASFDLAGVDDFKAGRFGHEPDLAGTVKGRDPERELVLLAHQPAEIEQAARHAVGLQLSGHTHGGQIWPFNNLVGLANPYVAGLHRHGPHTQIYVSCGTGYWGPPMRLGAPAEVTKVVLPT